MVERLSGPATRRYRRPCGGLRTGMTSLGTPPPIRGLTAADIGYVRALPIDYDLDRLVQLPKTLQEWWESELHQHLEAEMYAEHLERKKRLGGALRAFKAASSSLKSLEPQDREYLTAQMPRVRRERQNLSDVPHEAYFENRVNALQAEVTRTINFLDRISAAASTAEAERSRTTIWPLLVMRDLAAMYRYFTRRPPLRSDGGPDTGGFADFSEAIWNRVLGQKTGWHAAMKKWRESEEDARERSAFMANILLRHPDWRVLGR